MITFIARGSVRKGSPPPQEDEFLCVRCARHMETCCKTSEVYITPGDLERISRHSGDKDFHEFKAPTDPVYLDKGDDPAWLHFVFRDGGTRRVLKRRKDGACTFPGAAGCDLPLDIRPLICRIYPFDFNEEGLYEELARGCPTELLREGRGLLEELNMEIDSPRLWHKQLYEEIRLERPECVSGTPDSHS